MKRLSILRHAKSDWGTDEYGRHLDDIDRPLNKRGRRDAEALGHLLAAEQLQPGKIISSTAKRARQTAELAGQAIGFKPEDIEQEQELYLASTDRLLKTASGCHNTISHLMLIAHNPGMTELVNRVSNITLDNLPTCGLFCIEFGITEWSQIRASTGTCVWHHYPKMKSPQRL